MTKAKGFVSLTEKQTSHKAWVTAIHLEDRQLQNQTQEKRTGDLPCIFSSYTMNDTTDPYQFERRKED